MDTINDENAPPDCNINTKNTTTSNAGHGVKSLKRLSDPLSVRTDNRLTSTTNETQQPSEIIKQEEHESLSSPAKSDNDVIGDDDANLTEMYSIDGDFDDEQGDGFDDDFTYDEDDDIPLEEDPFFGNVQAETCPGQPTQEQLDFIARAVEEYKAKEAACGIPLPESPGDLLALESPGEHAQSSRDAPLAPFLPPHLLLNEQFHNAIEMVLEVRSSYGGDVFLVIRPIEPLYEMKLKFIQAVGLDVQPGALQFFYNDLLIEDDHTAKKIGLTSESLIHCQKVGAMRYDILMPKSLW
ncbi:hypothetical protein E4T42_08581 [Aureobasidium subglaciale]|nr:hypothetical protein E4T42_08581 [Aureobasidium subglaciale]